MHFDNFGLICLYLCGLLRLASCADNYGSWLKECDKVLPENSTTSGLLAINLPKYEVRNDETGFPAVSHDLSNFYQCLIKEVSNLECVRNPAKCAPDSTFSISLWSRLEWKDGQERHEPTLSADMDTNADSILRQMDWTYDIDETQRTYLLTTGVHHDANVDISLPGTAIYYLEPFDAIVAIVSTGDKLWRVVYPSLGSKKTLEWTNIAIVFMAGRDDLSKELNLYIDGHEVAHSKAPVVDTSVERKTIMVEDLYPRLYMGCSPIWPPSLSESHGGFVNPNRVSVISNLAIWHASTVSQSQIVKKSNEESEQYVQCGFLGGYYTGAGDDTCALVISLVSGRTDEEKMQYMLRTQADTATRQLIRRASFDFASLFANIIVESDFTHTYTTLRSKMNESYSCVENKVETAEDDDWRAIADEIIGNSFSVLGVGNLVGYEEVVNIYNYNAWLTFNMGLNDSGGQHSHSQDIHESSHGHEATSIFMHKIFVDYLLNLLIEYDMFAQVGTIDQESVDDDDGRAKNEDEPDGKIKEPVRNTSSSGIIEYYIMETNLVAAFGLKFESKSDLIGDQDHFVSIRHNERRLKYRHQSEIKVLEQINMEDNWIGREIASLCYPVESVRESLASGTNDVSMIIVIHRYDESMHLDRNDLASDTYVKTYRETSRLKIDSSIVTVKSSTNMSSVKYQKTQDQVGHFDYQDDNRIIVEFSHADYSGNRSALNSTWARRQPTWNPPVTSALAGNRFGWGRSVDQIHVWRKCVRWNNAGNTWESNGCRKKTRGRADRTICSCEIDKDGDATTVAVIRELGFEKGELELPFYEPHVGFMVARYLAAFMLLAMAISTSKWAWSQPEKLMNSSSMLVECTLHLTWSLAFGTICDISADMSAVRNEPDINTLVSLVSLYWTAASYVWIVICAISINRVVYTGYISGKQGAYVQFGYCLPPAIFINLLFQFADEIGVEWHCNIAASASAKHIVWLILLMTLALATIVVASTNIKVHKDSRLAKVRQRGMVSVLRKYGKAQILTICLASGSLLVMRLAQVYGLGNADGLIGQELDDGNANMYWALVTVKTWLNMGIAATAIIGGSLRIRRKKTISQ